jgi:sporulation protein YlmC with PRC-barrel domain
MSETTQYTIGAAVTCSDGICGKLNRVVVDPAARLLTHLVVEPRDRLQLGRLVPISLVDESAEGIRLRCSLSEFDALEDAEETRFLAEASEQLGYGAEEIFAWPYYGLGAGMGGMGGMGTMGVESTPQFVYDRVPVGEVEVRRGEHVHASDGNVGRVEGLVIDPTDHRVTHVLLERGHLWGKKEIAIPISAVTGVTPEGVCLNLTKAEVRELPAVDLAGGQ